MIQRAASREDADMRKLHALPAALVAALAASALAVTLGVGSSHREAPQIMLDPSADNTDVYAFTAKDAPGSLTVVANWIPFEDPSGGPNFGKLDPKARYYVKIDNDGDGVEDVAYRWQFTSRFRNPDTFLAAIPPVRSIDDPNINFVQTYDLYRERYNSRGKVTLVQEDRRRPAGRAGQLGPQDVPGLRRGRGGRDHVAERRRQDLRRSRATTRSSSTSPSSSTA